MPANGLVAGELDPRMFEQRQIETSNILNSRPDPSSVIGGVSVESFGTDRRQTKIFG